MEAIQSAYQSIIDFQSAWDYTAAHRFTTEHVEIPIFAVCLYLAFVFGMPARLKSPWNTSFLFGCWNIFLSVFSLLGVIHTVPYLIRTVYEKGFTYCVCESPRNWYLTGPVGLWTVLFVYSKLPELLDTVFLVLRKKPVIFLHWFHHVTVLLFCWHSFHTFSSSGLWFIAMNYSVHTVMYAYYMVMIWFPNKFSKLVAPFITLSQILQMVGGMTITAYSAYMQLTRPEGTEPREACDVDPANIKLGLALYLSYFILFATLFGNLYLTKDRRPKEGVRKALPSVACPPNYAPALDVGDSAGHFMGSMGRKGSISESRPSNAKATAQGQEAVRKPSSPVRKHSKKEN